MVVPERTTTYCVFRFSSMRRLLTRSISNYNVVLARRKLSQLLGLEQDDRELRGDLPTPQAVPVQSLKFDPAAIARTDIQALEERAEAASKWSTAQNLWFFPKVTL